MKKGNLKIKKNIAKTTALILALVLLPSCGKKYEKPVIEPIEEKDRLVVYTSHKEEVYAPIIKEFEERYGIWVDVKTAGTTEMLENIRNNYGEFICDVVFGGGAESYNAYSDYFIPYEVTDKDKVKNYDLSDKNYWTPFSELPVVIVYNKKLVAKEHVPTGWGSLFEPYYKGNIAFANPLNSGSSVTILLTILQALPGNDKTVLEDFVNQLDGKILESSGDVTSSVSEGKFTVGLTLEETACKAIEAGADIQIVYPSEGTSAVPDAAAIVQGAVHEENAGKFIEFITSVDVQKTTTSSMYRRSIRTDVNDAILPARLNLLGYSINQATSQREFLFSCWNEFTGAEVQDE